jgi:hypothetical protein
LPFGQHFSRIQATSRSTRGSGRPRAASEISVHAVEELALPRFEGGRRHGLAGQRDALLFLRLDLGLGEHRLVVVGPRPVEGAGERDLRPRVRALLRRLVVGPIHGTPVHAQGGATDLPEHCP